jgi:hypothetical protein
MAVDTKKILLLCMAPCSLVRIDKLSEEPTTFTFSSGRERVHLCHTNIFNLTEEKCLHVQKYFRFIFRRKQLPDYFKERRRYCKLKEEALDCTMWRTRFGRGYGPVVRQTTE